jgi:hypothetical protein
MIKRDRLLPISFLCEYRGKECKKIINNVAGVTAAA